MASKIASSNSSSWRTHRTAVCLTVCQFLVLNTREKSEIGQETSSYRQNELLLSALCYKSEEDFNKFLTALDKTDQGHVRNALTGRTEQEEERETGGHEDDDGTPELSQTSEILQLRQQLQQLNNQLVELRGTNASLEQKLIDAQAACQSTADNLTHGRTQWPQRPVARLEIGGVVTGVAELQDVIYTVRKDSTSIQSYKLDDSLARQKDIVVNGLEDACDIVACPSKLRLYVADQHLIWVVSPLSRRVDGRITPPVRPHSLSVRDGQLLVTSHHSRQLLQYSGEGLEVGRVSLPGNMTPEHAAHTSRGTFIVCTRTTSRRRPPNASSSEELHQMMEVGAGGETLRSFGSARGSDSFHRLNYPWYVVLDEATGGCFVADRNNGRVLHLDSELRPTGAVVDSPNDRPSRLCLSGERFLVAHSDCLDIYVLT